MRIPPMKHLMNKAQEHGLAIIIVLAAAAVLYLAVDLKWFNAPAPPIAYTASVFPAEREFYAPGETLRYTPTLTLRAETEIEGVRILVNARTRRTARLCDGTAAKPIPVLGGAEEGTEANIDGGAFVAIPIPKLPPGDYWVRSFVHGFGESGGQATYKVMFSITKKC